MSHHVIIENLSLQVGAVWSQLGCQSASVGVVGKDATLPESVLQEQVLQNQLFTDAQNLAEGLTAQLHILFMGQRGIDRGDFQVLPDHT